MFDPFASDDEGVFDVRTTAAGPAGSLPLTESMLCERPSGDLFGLSQNVGMCWSPTAAADRQFLVLSLPNGPVHHPTVRVFLAGCGTDAIQPSSGSRSAGRP